jgi:hypothetical protein
LTDPALTLFDDTGSTILTNNDWRDSQEAEIIATGIPPQNDLESAIVATLPPGKYTAALAGRNDGIGNGLVEVYDLEPNNSSTLANLSTRGYVGTNDNVMIGSFIIGSGESPILVVRAIGPSLADAGIADPLPNPTIELHDGNGAVIGFNDNWGRYASSGGPRHPARSDRRSGKRPSSPRFSRLETTPRLFAARARRPGSPWSRPIDFNKHHPMLTTIHYHQFTPQNPRLAS